MNACLLLAVSLDGCAVTTIEGLSTYPDESVTTPRGLHRLQQSFIDSDALQCGYCTPGQICSAVGLMNEHRPVNRQEIRERMSGRALPCRRQGEPGVRALLYGARGTRLQGTAPSQAARSCCWRQMASWGNH
jgi:aerobic-type carbon monoxide dehydrogenase small subunit (CoxS/CutS family)